MLKVMVFTSSAGAEWYSRGGAITVRNAREIAAASPERPTGLSHYNLHRMVERGAMKFKELRNE